MRPSLFAVGRLLGPNNCGWTQFRLSKRKDAKASTVWDKQNSRIAQKMTRMLAYHLSSRLPQLVAHISCVQRSVGCYILSHNEAKLVVRDGR